MESDAIVAVVEDLEYLASWGQGTSDAEIRRGSAILRRLLVEDAYGVAWRSIGFEKQPKLIAVSLELLLTGHVESDVVYALAQGTDIGTARVAGAVVSKLGKLVLPPPSIRPSRADGFPGEREFTLSEYLSSTSGIVHGKKFNRRDVIKYMANIKGGVHLSAEQRKAEAKLVARLGKIEKRIAVYKSDGLFVETLAIAQALARSDDAKTIIQKVRGV